MTPGATARLPLAVLAALAAAWTAHAQAPPTSSDVAVKADFLPKFARYVEWPAAARPAEGQPFQLCVIGQDPFGARLDQAAASEMVSSRPMTVRRMSGAEEAAGCHVAYVRGVIAEDTGRLLQALAARPVLTVTDGETGQAHGMIHFVVSDGRVGFLIDDAAAAERGLTISSRLLALARGVRQRRS